MPKIAGVYAIEGPDGVYVGQSGDIWNRSSFEMATRLGLECGIVRELPGSGRLERDNVEAEVARIFEGRGMVVVSAYKRAYEYGSAMKPYHLRY